MDEREFGRFLDNACRLTAPQANVLLQTLSRHYRYNCPFAEFTPDDCKALAWRMKQAYQIVNAKVNPQRR